MYMKQCHGARVRAGAFIPANIFKRGVAVPVRNGKCPMRGGAQGGVVKYWHRKLEV